MRLQTGNYDTQDQNPHSQPGVLNIGSDIKW